MPKLETVLRYKQAPFAGTGSVAVVTGGGGVTHDAVSLTVDADVLLALAGQVLDLDSQAANVVFAAPDGSAGKPTFRTLTANDFSLFDATAPTTITPDATGAAGTSDKAARRDHVHGIACAAPASPSVNLSASTEGGGTDFARAAHTHQLDQAITPTWTGAHLWGTNTEIRFRASSQRIYSSLAGQLDIDATTEIELVAPTVEINGDLQFVGSGQISTTTSNLMLAPTGNLTFNPTGNDVLPTNNYDINLGALTKKFLTLHAAELWVETLVAQDTIATIGGRILVGPTTQFSADLSSATVNGSESLANTGFETAGGGGADVFANWTENAGDGAIAQDSTTQHGGTYSCKLTAGTNANTNVYQNFSVSDTEHILIGFWHRGDGTKSGRVRVYDVTHSTNILGITSCGNATTIWKRVWIDFDVPAGCTSVRLYFYCPDTGGYHAFFDDATARTGIQITVKHNQMDKGDIAYSEAGGKVEFFEIASDASAAGSYYAYWVLRNLDATGANNWYAGDAVFNTGSCGEGFIDVYSVSGIAGTSYGPTICGNVRDLEGGGYNEWSERWAIGNLNGLYGVSANYYGVGLGNYASNNFLRYDTNGGFIISAGDGVLTLDTGGITATAGTAYLDPNAYKFRDPSSNIVAGLYGSANTGTGYAQAQLEVDASPAAYDYGQLGLYVHGGGTQNVIILRTGASVCELVIADSGYAYLDGSSTPDFKIQGGLYVGDAAGNPDPDDIHFDGNLKSVKGTTYDVYAFHPLASRIWHASFNGTSYSDVSSNTLIDNASWNTTIPTDAKALLIRMAICDSGSAGATTCQLQLYPTSGASIAAAAIQVAGLANDALHDEQAIVPCTDGDIWYTIDATGTNTMDVWLWVVGYWI